MRILKWVGIVLGALVLTLFGAFLYFKSAAQARYAKPYTIEVEAIPMPFPLTPREIDKLRAEILKERKAAEGAAQPTAAPTEGAQATTDVAAPTTTDTPATDAAPVEAAGTAQVPAAEPGAMLRDTDIGEALDVKAIAKERAIARGKRYVESRAACTECHGADFGGKVIMDNPVMGTWIAPNITRAGVTAEYTSVDWVRILRHGVKPDGTAASMPSTDFTWFSDQEISDIAMYINSVPKVDRVMPPSTLGPVFSMLIAQGEIPVSAEVIDHTAERPKYPPRADVVSTELGKHLATTCTGCHGQGLSGGPVQGGDPNWLPARNLTFHETGLATWTLEQFQKAMRDGVRPDGAPIQLPMPIAYTSKLNDDEIESLYEYLKTVEPKAYGNH